MLAFLAELRKRRKVTEKQQKIELKKYDKLLKKEEAVVAELETKYKTKSKRGHGKKLR